MDTVNFTVNNNPNIAKAKEENNAVSTNSDVDVEKIISDKIANYEKGRDEDIGELTSVVEEIADRLVEENKGIKRRIKELENSYSNMRADNSNNIVNADFSETKEIVESVETKLNKNIEENKQKINELKSQGENNLATIQK